MLKTKIRDYRMKLHLKQEDLAKWPVSAGDRVHLEAGRYNPSLKLGMQVAKILNTSVEDLFVFIEDET